MTSEELLTTLYELSENHGGVLDDWDEGEEEELCNSAHNLADTLNKRAGGPGLTDAAQLALGCILRNGVYELSERAAVAALEAAIRASGATPRGALTTDELIALIGQDAPAQG